MFSNARLRLLMKIVGFERLGVEDVLGAAWIVPSSLKSEHLRETISEIVKALATPFSGEGDDDPRNQLQKKDRGSGRGDTLQGTLDVNFGSESEGEDIPDGPLFPANPRSKASALDELKKKRKKKSKPDAEREPLDDETLEARRDARLANSLSRQAKIKSDLFIHASDEESDAEADKEFFRLEEERRKKQAFEVKKALLAGPGHSEKSGKGKSKKSAARKRDSDTGAATKSKRQRRGSASASGADSDADGDILMAETDDQPAGSPDANDDNGSLPSDDDDLLLDDDLAFGRDRSKPEVPEPDDEDEPVAPTRRRMRGGFVIESDSE